MRPRVFIEPLDRRDPRHSSEEAHTMGSSQSLSSKSVPVERLATEKGVRKQADRTLTVKGEPWHDQSEGGAARCGDLALGIAPTTTTGGVRATAAGGVSLLFPVLGGAQTCCTIYMTVRRNATVCVGCSRTPNDARGTLFACCKANVCSGCTDVACVDAAERLWIDMRRVLVGSGAVLERVSCPACGSLERVGFPINPEFGRVFASA